MALFRVALVREDGAVQPKRVSILLSDTDFAVPAFAGSDLVPDLPIQGWVFSGYERLEIPSQQFLLGVSARRAESVVYVDDDAITVRNAHQRMHVQHMGDSHMLLVRKRGYRQSRRHGIAPIAPIALTKTRHGHTSSNFIKSNMIFGH
ncbi:MAG: hypothetical protein QUV20_12895 [Oceanibaculum nanhaiense]|nr:hypothetical protein [Oceanibaculum nanhaiense]MDM7947222.1 hypothetical protein [Oceanibaculum nanhaiense]